MAKRDSLERYRRRRNFRRSPEPSGGRRRKRRTAPVFVIQKHAASTLHYDFRLQVGDALRSWAVPKGPSTDPRDKRLAVPTEDHPLEYADFEGVIGEGQYGAGSVIVWDAGEYRNLTERDGNELPIDQALDAGHAVVYLDGHKLCGAWTLQRTARGKDERWLLVKKKGEGADARRKPVKTQPESVLSGKTIEQLRAS